MYYLICLNEFSKQEQRKESTFETEIANFQSCRLSILEMVLNDQLKVLGEFEQAIASKDENHSVTQNKVLLSHLERIQRMNKQSERTYQAVSGQIYS